MPFIVAADDPITAVLLRDWAQVGGWSLFLSLVMFLTIGMFREWWVPGGRHHKLEDASKLLLEANSDLTKQNGQLITANEITKHFFEETVPRRVDFRPPEEETIPIRDRRSDNGTSQT